MGRGLWRLVAFCVIGTAVLIASERITGSLEAGLGLVLGWFSGSQIRLASRVEQLENNASKERHR